MEKDRRVTQTPWPEIITLLSDILVFDQYDFQRFLQKFIKILITIIPVDSCLIYFHDKGKKQLILIASKKPHEQELGKITMEEGEGITGWVAEHKKTVAIEERAYEDPRFKPFKELPEDKYESFLSVPIVDRTGVIGVINLQSRQPLSFSAEQIQTTEALVKIIASAFAKTVLERKVMRLENQLEDRKVLEKAKGVIMKTHSLSEENAFHFLRTEAMKKRKTMREIADAVLLVFQ